MRKIVLLVLLCIQFVACSSGGTPIPIASPTGPPEIDAQTIEAHAQQFEDELTDRSAGSQEEFAAATYITAHLQQAGYVVEFDSVPIANTVRSTNVIALPPSGEDPEFLVTVGYDKSADPEAIGAFLELARALRVVAPNHSVEFAALGAESADVAGGELGSRRMVQLLRDRQLNPRVVQLVGTTPQTWAVDGYIESDLCRADKNGCVVTGAAIDPDVFADAGLDRSLLAAPAEELATFLLRYLSR